MISLPTGADLALVLFAVARAGLIAVPTAPGAEVAELADRVHLGAGIRVSRTGWASPSVPPTSRSGGSPTLRRSPVWVVARTWSCWRALAVTGR